MTSNPAAVFSSELQQAGNGSWGYCIKRFDTGAIVAQSHGHEKDFAINLMEYDLVVLEDEESCNWRHPHDFVYEVSQSDDGLWQCQIHEKATQKLVGSYSDLRDRDTAYAHVANYLMGAGCNPKEASRVMLQGQGLIDVVEDGTIHLHVQGFDDDA